MAASPNGYWTFLSEGEQSVLSQAHLQQNRLGTGTFSFTTLRSCVACMILALSLCPTAPDVEEIVH